MIMKKAIFNCHYFGNPEHPVILLIHGMGFYWEKCFAGMIGELQKKYYCIIPELAGHHNENRTEEISLEDMVYAIESQLKLHQISKIRTLYGISFGASIAVELAFRGNVKINQLVIDGAQFVNLGWMKKISAFVMAKQFKNIAKGKHMNAYVKGQLGYQNKNEISIFKKLMCENISENVLYKSAYECYRYDICKKGNLDCNLYYLYGEKEAFAVASKGLIQKKVNGVFLEKRFENFGHAEVLGYKPEILVDIFISIA